MELRHYASIVLKWWWLILLTTVLGAGGAYYMNRNALPVYRASTTLTIDRGGDPREDVYYAIRTSEALASTYVVQIEAPVILEEVRARLGLDMSANAIKGMLTVSQVEGTQLINISAQGYDPALVKALVETVAQVFIEHETSQQEARYQSQLDTLMTQAATLEKSLAIQRICRTLPSWNWRNWKRSVPTSRRGWPFCCKARKSSGCRWPATPRAFRFSRRRNSPLPPSARRSCAISCWQRSSA
jgi:capsular polysaccharide biosynthesis protein